MKTRPGKIVIKFAKRIVILSIGFFHTSYGQESFDTLSSNDTGLKVAYIGNMGVLIEHNEKTVIFDGFHKKYKPDYLFPDLTTVTDLTHGTYADFSAIEIALFSHKHADHFDASYSQLFLNKNPDGIVVGSSQVKEEIQKLKENEASDFGNSLKAVPYDEKPHVLECSGIQVTGIQCEHVNPSRHSSVQNIAYLVTLDGFKVLHIGDTNWSLVDRPFNSLELKSQEIDIAILPYWMLLSEEAKELTIGQINPTKLIATHIPPNFSESDKKELMSTYRNVELFTELNQTFTYSKK